MFIRTGKEPHVEHLHIPVGTNKIGYRHSGEFATVPVSDLQRGGEVWIVRLAPSSEMTPTFIFWAEPKISKKGLVMELAGFSEKAKQDRIGYELSGLQAPQDVMVEYRPSRFYGGDERGEVKITFWEIEA